MQLTLDGGLAAHISDLDLSRWRDENDRNLETTSLQAGRRRDRRDIDGPVRFAVHPRRHVSDRTSHKSELIS